MKTLYVDCISGAAGDMLLAALIDAGASESYVRGQLETLNIPGWDLSLEMVERGGLRSLKAQVTVSDDTAARAYGDIVSILDRSSLDDRVRHRALTIFEKLGVAEGRVHGVALDDLHLHEAGALDALVDVVGCSAALESLHCERVVVSAIPTGRGTIATSHGTMPIPGPAVFELLKGMTIYERGEEELITPTGAAILAGVVDSSGAMPQLSIEAIGYGAGAAELVVPNVVRVVIGESVDVDPQRTLVLLETNLDDLSPELVPHVIEMLLEAGAFDAWTTPVSMKKSRHGVILSALSEPDDAERLADLIYRETTTMGIRMTTVTREALDREWWDVTVDGLPVRVKIARRGGEVVTIAPEFEDARTVARATGIPLKEVYAQATEAARSRQRSSASETPAGT